MNPSISSAQLPNRILKKKTKLKAKVDHNLDAQSRPNNSAPFNKSLRIQVTVWIHLYRLPGCLSEFYTKKDDTDAMMDQNLDAQIRPNNLAPFNK